MWRVGPAEARARIGRRRPKPRGREEARPQDPGETLRWEVEALRVEVGSFREHVEEVKSCVSQGPEVGSDKAGVGEVDADDDGQRQRVVQRPRRVFPELITEEP